MLKGLLDPCLLAVTAERPAYGYEIVKRLAEAGLAEVAEGSVYPALARLERGLLLRAERIESTGGPPRKYYEPTQLGRLQLEKWRQSWAELSGSINLVLSTSGERAPCKENAL